MLPGPFPVQWKCSPHVEGHLGWCPHLHMSLFAEKGMDLCIWGKSFAAAGMTKWEWTRSAGYSSSRRLWIKCREQSRKFFKSNNHARQITPPLLSLTLIQRKILCAAISAPLRLIVSKRRGTCWGCGLGHAASSKMALSLCGLQQVILESSEVGTG